MEQNQKTASYPPDANKGTQRAERPLTQAIMAKWLKAMKAAKLPQAAVHYPDGTKIVFRTTSTSEDEGDTWADVT